MKKYILLILTIAISVQAQTLDEKVASTLVFAEQQLMKTVADIDTTSIYLFPTRATDGTKWSLSKAQKWTSGFFPGCMWYMYQHSDKEEWKHLAKRWTAWLEVEKTRTSVYADLGFEMMLSFGHGLRLIGDSSYIPILIESADSYLGRYKRNIRVLSSWDRTVWYQDPNIVSGQIDQLMNMELIFEVAQHAGDTSYYNIAVENVETFIDNHIRDDYSTFKTVRYNANTGAVVNKGNALGANDSSTWSRGHSWGTYSLVMYYRYTQDERYLNIAKKLADYFYSNIPEDGFTYWDFDAPDIPDAPKDGSGMTIVTSALFEMITFLDDQEEIEKYRNMAYNMLNTLCSAEHLSDPDISNTILKKGDAKVVNNILISFPAIFADYYLIEAMLRYQADKATTIDSDKKSDLATIQNFQLEQNYPNPFNPETTIEYKLSKSSDIRIVIYDVLGKEIIELINSNHSAGQYQVKWNGKNKSNQMAGTGIYYYKMTADDFTSVNKMILMK